MALIISLNYALKLEAFLFLMVTFFTHNLQMASSGLRGSHSAFTWNPVLLLSCNVPMAYIEDAPQLIIFLEIKI